jgi:hypothetical protein
MDRRAFLTGAGAGLLIVPLVGEAQQTRNLRTIAFFGPSPEVGGGLVHAFQ